MLGEPPFSTPHDQDNINYRTGRTDRPSARATNQLRMGVSAHLDAENLFDACYLESGYSNVWITPGAPRSVREAEDGFGKSAGGDVRLGCGEQSSYE